MNDILVHFFIPIEIFHIGDFIVDASVYKTATYREYAILHSLSVSKIVSLGSYLEVNIPPTPPNTCHGNWKLRNGYGVDLSSVSFSITTKDNKIVYSGGHDAKKKKFIDLYSISTINVENCKLLKIVPNDVFLFTYSHDQCHLLLYAAVEILYKTLPANFDGLLPVSMYLGPERLSTGGPQSIAFLGFPFIQFLCFDGECDQNTCTGCTLDTFRCLGGLPKAFGSRNVTYQISTMSVLKTPPNYEQLYASSFTDDVIKCTQCDTEGMPGLPDWISFAFMKRGALIRLTLRDINYALLCKCLGWYQRPVKCNHHRSRDKGVAGFIRRQKYDNAGLYESFQRTKHFILSMFRSDAENKTHVKWLLLDHSQHIYFFLKNDHGIQSICIQLEEIFRALWETVIQSNRKVSIVKEAYVGDCFLFVFDNTIVSSLYTNASSHNWISDAESCLILLVNELKSIGSESDAFHEILFNYFKNVFLYMLEKKHVTCYWTCKCFPLSCENTDTDGVFDCAPFSGVYAKDGLIIVQTNMSLSDHINYITYFNKTSELGWRVISFFYKVITNEEFQGMRNAYLDDQEHLLKINN